MAWSLRTFGGVRVALKTAILEISASCNLQGLKPGYPERCMRWLSSLLPLATLVVVAYLVFVVGAPRSVVALRLLGGPTDELARFSALLLCERDGSPCGAEKLELSARATSGQTARTGAAFDEDGLAEVALDFAAPPRAFELSISRDGEELAKGRVELSGARWRSKVVRRGGFHGGAAAGELSLSIAPARGVFAVPYTSPLFVRAPVGAAFDLRAEGARIKPTHAVAGENGLVRVDLTPLEHVVTVQVKATAGTQSGSLSATVPVAAGALMARWDEKGIVVSSPVPRDVAYLAVLSESGRVAGFRVKLHPSAEGAESDLVPLEHAPSGQLWARAASDPFASGTSMIGWPLFESDSEPETTFDVRDVTLLDSGAGATARERARRRGVLAWALVVGLCGALASILSVLARARRSNRLLEAHLDGALGPGGAELVAPRARTRSLFGMVLIALGFLVVAALLAWRLRR